MKAKRKNRKVVPFMVTGLLLLVAALLLAGYNAVSEKRAEEGARQALGQLEAIQTAAQEAKKEPETAGEIPIYEENPDMEMPVAAIDGYDYIGTLEIPSLNLTLPVLSQWSYEGLRTAPCRYTGSVYNGTMTIAAHNYSSHFGNLTEISQGEEIRFTDADGNVFLFRAASMEQLEETAISEMTESPWDLTLFTCTYGGAARIALRCEKVTE